MLRHADQPAWTHLYQVTLPLPVTPLQFYFFSKQMGLAFALLVPQFLLWAASIARLRAFCHRNAPFCRDMNNLCRVGMSRETGYFATSASVFVCIAAFAIGLNTRTQFRPAAFAA